jgi:putative ABC transport system permease protein
LLTGSGVAIGIASLVAVLGVSTSSRADLLATLDALGTDLLTVRPGEDLVGADTALPASAPASVRRVEGVESAAATFSLEATVRRTDRVPSSQTSGVRVVATEASLVATLRGELTTGRFFDTVTNEHAAVVLGSTAARRLGIDSLDSQPLVWLADQWFAVVGVLEPVPLAPELDSTALIAVPAAERVLGLDPVSIEPTNVYVRVEPGPGLLDEVRQLMPRSANPGSPDAVRVSRPSDALAARAAVDTSFTALLLALGGIALLVGGIGIANVMVVAVLERRTEIGLRRALGAARLHIRVQFLLEAAILSGAGGLAGVALGAGAAAGYAAHRSWPFALPLEGLAGAVVLAAGVGVLAGIYPAGRAARLQPADAVRPG